VEADSVEHMGGPVEGIDRVQFQQRAHAALPR